MRITYRNRDNKKYWTDRWSKILPDSPMSNKNLYPLKYVENLITSNDGPILEAGCSAGRILRYYHEKGYNITGIDYIEVLINKLRAIDSTLNVETGDIKHLRFADASFKYVLAFGLYHNIEHKLDVTISETARVLQTGGSVCASFRADNIQTRIIDWLADRKSQQNGKLSEKIFHKMNFSKDEIISLFKGAGFLIESVSPVENMPFLYKFEFFRSRTNKEFDEHKFRADGCQLSFIGQAIQFFLIKFFPDQFCNIYV